MAGTQASLLLVDEPDGGLTVEGRSSNPADEHSAANAVVHYIMRHWDAIVRSAVLFEKTGATVPVDHTKVGSQEDPGYPQNGPLSYRGSETRSWDTGIVLPENLPREPATDSYSSGGGGDFGGGGASGSWDSGSTSSDSGSSYSSD